MSNLENKYELEEDKSADDLKFFFISKGQEKDVVKAIQYSFVQVLNQRMVYNLGFGDYDIEADRINDNVNTNNGDAYKVFNTVLSTIELFFENYTGAVLMVQGSDGRPEFAEQCKTTCTKKCTNECKNYNRRINVYKGYVDKNYETLSIDYQFFGGFKTREQGTVLEPYELGKRYDSVFLFQK